MDLRDIRSANQRRHVEWAAGKDVSLSFRGLELGGETGELLNELKKLERIRLGLAGGKCDLQAIEEELADVMICVDLIAMDLDIELGPAIQKNSTRLLRSLGCRRVLTRRNHRKKTDTALREVHHKKHDSMSRATASFQIRTEVVKFD